MRQTEVAEGATSAVAPVKTESPKRVKPIRTYEVELAHNSLILMNAGCQERYKHTYVVSRSSPCSCLLPAHHSWSMENVTVRNTDAAVSLLRKRSTSSDPLSTSTNTPSPYTRNRRILPESTLHSASTGATFIQRPV